MGLVYVTTGIGQLRLAFTVVAVVAHVLSIMLTVGVRALEDLAALSLCGFRIGFGFICLMFGPVDVYCLLFVGVVLSDLVLGIRIAE